MSVLFMVRMEQKSPCAKIFRRKDYLVEIRCGTVSVQRIGQPHMPVSHNSNRIRPGIRNQGVHIKFTLPEKITRENMEFIGKYRKVRITEQINLRQRFLFQSKSSFCSGLQMLTGCPYREKVPAAFLSTPFSLPAPALLSKWKGGVLRSVPTGQGYSKTALRHGLQKK